MYQIATHLALDRVRSAAHWQALRHEPMEADAASLAQADHGQAPVHAEMCQCIRGMVDELPLGYRVILGLSELQDLDLGEIAALLGISRGAAKIRLHRARRMLRERMEQGCRILVDDRGEIGCDPKSGVSAEGSAPSQKVKGGHHVRIHRNLQAR